jgi:hypothetical protein
MCYITELKTETLHGEHCYHPLMSDIGARVNQHPPVHHPTGVLVGAGSLWLTTKASQDTIRPSAKHFSHILSQAVAVVSLTTSQLPPLQDTPPS